MIRFLVSTRWKVPCILLSWSLLLAVGCKWNPVGKGAAIEVTLVPHEGAGGPDHTEYIGGKVTGAKPGQKIVIYAQSGGLWWIQPVADHPLTEIQPDSTWKNITHLGTEYAVLLVDGNYRLQPRIFSLPAAGNGVSAVMTAKGTQGTESVAVKTIHFSGYDWTVQAASNYRGGETNVYDPSNVWVDEHGYLHLYMGMRKGQWTCAELSLNRSLGFGTYRFVVQDVSHMTPSTVFGMYTWDPIHAVDIRNEIDVEISRWANPSSLNAQYVIQPFYVASNVYRFATPPGVLTYSFQWQPGSVAFRTMRGVTGASKEKPISEHTFASGTPSPANETVHIDLYDFGHSRHATEQPVELVVQKFEYVP